MQYEVSATTAFAQGCDIHSQWLYMVVMHAVYACVYMRTGSVPVLQ